MIFVMGQTCSFGEVGVEDCDDGEDNDLDGYVDCEDDDCECDEEVVDGGVDLATCVPSEPSAVYNLEDFPDMFDESGAYAGYLVVADAAESSYESEAISIMVRALESNGLTVDSNANKSDNEVDDVNDKNIITVGDVCTNTVLQKILCYDATTCEDALTDLGVLVGQAYIGLLETDQGFHHLVLVGGSPADIRYASDIMAEHECYDLDESEVVATTVSASSLSVGNDVCPGEEYFMFELGTGESLTEVQEEISSTELPTFLDDETYRSNNGTVYTCTQTLNFPYFYTNELSVEHPDQDSSEYYFTLNNTHSTWVYTIFFDPYLDVSYIDNIFGTELEIQNNKYTIIDVNKNNDSALTDMTLMSGTQTWISQSEVITRTFDGVDHTIELIEVSEDELSCNLYVDGSETLIDVGDIQNVNGINVGVLDAQIPDQDQDVCMFIIGNKYTFISQESDESNVVKVNDETVSGTTAGMGLFTNNAIANYSKVDRILIYFTPEEDVVMSPGDEYIFPVFGSLKYVFGGYSEIDGKGKVYVADSTAVTTVLDDGTTGIE